MIQNSINREPAIETSVKWFNLPIFDIRIPFESNKRKLKVKKRQVFKKGVLENCVFHNQLHPISLVGLVIFQTCVNFNFFIPEGVTLQMFFRTLYGTFHITAHRTYVLLKEELGNFGNYDIIIFSFISFLQNNLI